MRVYLIARNFPKRAALRSACPLIFRERRSRNHATLRSQRSERRLNQSCRARSDHNAIGGYSKLVTENCAKFVGIAIRISREKYGVASIAEQALAGASRKTARIHAGAEIEKMAGRQVKLTGEALDISSMGEHRGHRARLRRRPLKRHTARAAENPSNDAIPAIRKEFLASFREGGLPSAQSSGPRKASPS